MYDLPPTFLARLDSIIADNLHDEDFSIEMLCRALSISYTHTYRKIRQETGLSPSMYICKKRLEVACHLLQNTDLNMGQIAYKVGFNTQAYFSKCFSDRYNCPPKRYRNQLLQAVNN